MAWSSYRKYRSQRSGGYGQKGFGGRSTRRYPGKRSFRKRSSRGKTMGVSKLARELADMKRGRHRRHQLRAFPEVAPVYLQGVQKDEDGTLLSLPRLCHFLVPVTQGIPPVEGAGEERSDERRDRRKCRVSSVEVRFTVQHSVTVAVAAVCYENKVGPVVKPDVGAGGMPESFALGMKEGKGYRLLGVQEVGFLHEDGPYKVLLSGGQVPMLDSADGSMLDARIREGVGAPLGKMEWRIGHKHEPGVHKRYGRTVNQMVAVRGGALDGRSTTDGLQEVEQGTTTPVRLFCKVDKDVTFRRETSGELMWENDVQVCVMVCCPGGELRSAEQAVMGAVVRNVVVDVRFQS